MQEPEGMGGNPLVVRIMDEGKELRAIEGETSRCTVVACGFGSRADIQVGTMRLPESRGSGDHNITGQPLSIGGQGHQILALRFPLGNVDQLLGISVPTGPPA